MARRPILTGDDPALRAVARPVGRPDGDTRRLVDDLWETMLAADGAGLAAPQVGVGLRVIVLGIDPDEDPELTAPLHLRVIDPVVTRRRGEGVDMERCLSLPGVRGAVPRAREITLSGLDPDGRPIRVDLRGWSARIAQHEVDHLDGILYPDRMPPGTAPEPIPAAAPRRRTRPTARRTQRTSRR